MLIFLGLHFLLLLHVRKLPEFMPLMARDRSGWPRCLLWHGWLLGLCMLHGERAPWADCLRIILLFGPSRWCWVLIRSDDSEFLDPF